MPALHTELQLAELIEGPPDRPCVRHVGADLTGTRQPTDLAAAALEGIGDRRSDPAARAGHDNAGPGIDVHAGRAS